jgi:peptidoglycan-associated lipoprotein
MGLTKDHSLIIFQRRLIMIKKSYSILILILCVGLIMTGCPKKTVMKEEASSMKSEELARETEQKEMEGVKTKEVEPSKVQEKEFEKSLVAKAEPGIEGEVLESKLLEDIHFDFDKYDIRPGDAEILKENAALLVKFSNTKIQIEGHCDERGTIEYNLALGERRANHAKKYLISLGIPENRLSTISYGKERPLDPGHNEEAWAKNRRAHFIILSK